MRRYGKYSSSLLEIEQRGWLRDHRLPDKQDEAIREENNRMAAAEIDRIEKTTALVPHLLDIAHKKIWVDCDQ